MAEKRQEQESKSAEEGLKREMIAERKKRQDLEQKLEEMQERISKNSDTQVPDSVEELISEEDLAQMDATAINRKIAEKLKPLDDLATRLEDLQKRQMSKEESEKIRGILDKYDIYQDSDKELAQDARTALEVAMKNLGDDATEEDLDKEAQKVAKRFSRFKANSANAEEQEDDVVPPGGGSPGAAAHHDKGKPKNASEAITGTVKSALKRFGVAE